jgi:hypothetical protein
MKSSNRGGVILVGARKFVFSSEFQCSQMSDGGMLQKVRAIGKK